MINLQFTSNGLPEDTFQILEINGEEHISQLFRFELRLVSRDPDIDFKSILENSAFVEITTQDKTRYVHGMLAEFKQAGAWHSGLYEYNAVLVPRLWMMTQSMLNQIYQNQTVPEIIESELGNLGDKGDHPLVKVGLGVADYDLYTQSPYEQREYVVQYKETDFNFISRLMEHEGIYYYFEHDEDVEKLVITDEVAQQQGDDLTPVMYQAEAAVTSYTYNAVSRFSRTQKQIPGSVLVKDFNYRSPSLPMQATGDVTTGGIGFVTEFGAHFKSPEEGEKLANIRAEEYRCQQNIYEGESNVSNFSCGQLYSLMNHFRDDYNQDYLITKVIHHASQAIQSWEIVGDTNYHNEFSCIPSDLPYRPQRLTPKPKLYGIMNGVIDSEQDMNRADIDELGRYKVMMPFDISGSSPGKASRRIRMAQPYGGGGAGMSFPLVKGTEVIWTCIDGDIDRPIITGAVPNPLNPSVTNTENNTSNMIKTTSGMTMGFHDGTGSSGQAETGTGDGLTAQQQNQKLTYGNQQKTVDSSMQKRVNKSVSYEITTQQQQTSYDSPCAVAPQKPQQIGDLKNYQIDLGTPIAGDTSGSSGKRYTLGVPDYLNAQNASASTADSTHQDSYLRLGKAADFEFQTADFDGDGTAEHTNGWFEYTDGNRLSITHGKRTDLITGTSYKTQVETDGEFGYSDTFMSMEQASTHNFPGWETFAYEFAAPQLDLPITLPTAVMGRKIIDMTHTMKYQVGSSKKYTLGVNTTAQLKQKDINLLGRFSLAGVNDLQAGLVGSKQFTVGTHQTYSTTGVLSSAGQQTITGYKGVNINCKPPMSIGAAIKTSLALGGVTGAVQGIAMKGKALKNLVVGGATVANGVKNLVSGVQKSEEEKQAESALNAIGTTAIDLAATGLDLFMTGHEWAEKVTPPTTELSMTPASARLGMGAASPAPGIDILPGSVVIGCGPASNIIISPSGITITAPKIDLISTAKIMVSSGGLLDVTSAAGCNIKAASPIAFTTPTLDLSKCGMIP